MSFKKRISFTPYDVARKIKSLEKIELTIENEKLIQDRIKTLTRRYWAYGFYMVTDLIYRARKNEGTELFTNVSDIWYKKAEDVTSHGRLNRPGETFLYTSNTFEGALQELAPQTGEIYTIMVIAPINPPVISIYVTELGLGHCNSDQLVNTFTTPISLKEHEGIRQTFAKNSDYKAWLAYDSFLNKKLTEKIPKNEKGKYILTSNLAAPFFRVPKVEAILYPSTADSLESLNLCIKPEYADKALRPHKIFTIRIEGIYTNSATVKEPTTTCKYSIVKPPANIDDNGNILWGDGLGSGILYSIEDLIQRRN